MLRLLCIFLLVAGLLALAAFTNISTDNGSSTGKIFFFVFLSLCLAATIAATLLTGKK